MYEYLEGVITLVTPSYIVVDVNGVGYKVFSPTPFAYKEEKKLKYILNKTLVIIMALLFMVFKVWRRRDYF